MLQYRGLCRSHLGHAGPRCDYRNCVCVTIFETGRDFPKDKGTLLSGTLHLCLNRSRAAKSWKTETTDLKKQPFSPQLPSLTNATIIIGEL